MARVYIAGPMRNLPKLNFPEFAAVAARLRELGHDVVSPVEIGRKHFGDNVDLDPHEYLAKDILELMTCDAICLLPGWEGSTGASCEAVVAKTLGFEFLDIFGESAPTPTNFHIGSYGLRKNAQTVG